MAFRVFAQSAPGQLDIAALLRQAKRFFEAELSVLSQRGLLDSAPHGVTGEWPSLSVRLESARRGFWGEYRVTCREASGPDWDTAREAEVRGRATGMGLLAARCPSVWEIEPLEQSCDAALLNLCAVLASLALGPVLPDDEATLYGVRGAMERVEAKSGRSLQR